MAINLDNLQQILWEDWASGYWIETISQYEPIIFLKIGDQSHKDQDNLVRQPSGENVLFVAFVEGEDGFTYKMTKNGRVPVYTPKKEL